MNYKEAQDKWIELNDQRNEADDLLREVNAKIRVIMKAGESRAKSGILQNLRAESNKLDRQVQVLENEMDAIIQSLA